MFVELESRPRHIITADTEDILGGVLLTRTGVVVDTAENSEAYEEALDSVDRYTNKNDELGELGILRAVYVSARERVPFINNLQYGELLKKMAIARSADDDLLTQEHRVGLSEFIGSGGICQENALFQATLLTLLRERGDLSGAIKLESIRPDGAHPDRHIRTSYATPEDVYVLDIEFGGVRAASWSSYDSARLAPIPTWRTTE